MKKVKYLLLILCIGVLFTGCGKAKDKEVDIKEPEKEEEKKEEVVDETLVKINGLEFHLDKEISYEKIKYTTIKDFTETKMSNYVQYRYSQEDGTNLLFFRIFYYAKKDNSVARKDLGIEDKYKFEDGKTENIEYKAIKEPRDDGGTINYYFINKDNSTYVLSFISKYDIKDFESKVLNSVKF